MKIEEVIFDARYEYNDVGTNFDSEQTQRVIHLLEVVELTAPDDLEFFTAIMRVLNEASSNEVGFHNFEMIMSTLQEKYLVI